MKDLTRDVFAQELTLSSELMEKLPESVQDWQPSHVCLWLEEVFDGAEVLPT